MNKEDLALLVKPIAEAYRLDNDLKFADLFIRIIIHQDKIVYIQIGEEEKIKFD